MKGAARWRLAPLGLVRITLKKAYADGTVAVDMDPLSLLCRLAASLPSPRPVAVREIAVIGRVLDHTVQRDVFDDLELSYLSLRVLGLASVLGRIEPRRKRRQGRAREGGGREVVEVGSAHHSGALAQPGKGPASSL